MKILYFCAFIDLEKGSGSAIRPRLLIEGLSNLGVKVAVIAFGVPPKFDSLGVQSYIWNKRTDYPTLLKNAIRNFKPDVLFVNTEAGADWALQAAIEFNVFLAFDLHSIGVIEIIELGRDIPNRIPRIKNSVRWLCCINKADLITVANPTLLNPIKFLFPAKRVFPLFGVTDTKTFSPTGNTIELGSDPANLHVLYAGNFYKWQGIEKLLKAAVLVQNRGLAIDFSILGGIGKKQQKTVLEKYNLPVNILRFLGKVDLKLAASYFRSSDVLIIPRPFMISTYLAFPQKICDYMASGRMVIATDLAPHRWAINHKIEGIIVNRTPSGIVAGLILAMDKNLREKCGNNAREKAIKYFDKTAKAKQLMRYFVNNINQQDKRKH